MVNDEIVVVAKSSDIETPPDGMKDIVLQCALECCMLDRKSLCGLNGRRGL